MIRVLLVEDDTRLASALTDVLESHGFAVTSVSTGAAALAADTADLVLLDLGLPDMDGLDVLSGLRSRYDMRDAGIIVLTARGQTVDRIQGLRAGADDYLPKPVSIAELTARIEAVARRMTRSRPTTLRVGVLELDMGANEARVSGTALSLTVKEFELLAALMEDHGRTVHRDRLLLRVWRTVYPSTARSLEVHISALRSKLAALADDDMVLIETVRGVGYRLMATPCTAG